MSSSVSITSRLKCWQYSCDSMASCCSDSYTSSSSKYKPTPFHSLLCSTLVPSLKSTSIPSGFALQGFFICIEPRSPIIIAEESPRTSLFVSIKPYWPFSYERNAEKNSSSPVSVSRPVACTYSGLPSKSVQRKTG